MANITVNLKDLDTLAKRMDNLVNEYNNVIDDLFYKINNLETSGAWIGTEAEKYISRILVEKKENEIYKNFGLDMKNFVDRIDDINHNINDTVTKMRVKI